MNETQLAVGQKWQDKDVRTENRIVEITGILTTTVEYRRGNRRGRSDKARFLQSFTRV